MRVGLELGKKWVFASALDWPGWCRRGQGEQAALDVLLDHAGRYGAVAGPGFEPAEIRVIGQVPGSATTDFGAPGVPGPWDDEPLGPDEAGRLTGLRLARARPRLGDRRQEHLTARLAQILLDHRGDQGDDLVLGRPGDRGDPDDVARHGDTDQLRYDQ